MKCAAKQEETLNTYQDDAGRIRLQLPAVLWLCGWGRIPEQQSVSQSAAQELTKVYVNEKFGDLVFPLFPEENPDHAVHWWSNGQPGPGTGQEWRELWRNGDKLRLQRFRRRDNLQRRRAAMRPTSCSTLSVSSDPTLTDVIADDNGANFYIVQVIATDAESFKDEAVDTIASISALSSEASIFYFEKYNFTVYDKTIYDQLESNYADYLIQAKSK